MISLRSAACKLPPRSVHASALGSAASAPEHYADAGMATPAPLNHDQKVHPGRSKAPGIVSMELVQVSGHEFLPSSGHLVDEGALIVALTPWIKGDAKLGK